MNTQTVAGMIAGARSRIQNLSVGEVAAELKSGNVLLVDIREPEERNANGTIPGAVPAVRGMLEFYADPTSPYHRPEFETDRRIVLTCASGGRSALAADALQQLGYTQVAHLDGGLKAWVAAGQPVETV
ncbi:rhodanese-like domain-containing protein [soil metagenome]